MDTMKKILIQANNLNTVIDVFMYVYLHPNCKKQDVADLCGFSLRQVDYYTNACKYLGLIDDEWKPTHIAKDIFENSRAEIPERIYQLIEHDEMMGQIYDWMMKHPEDNPSQYAKEVVMDFFPGLSEAVYNRRSDNIVKWCRKIINKSENN